MRVPRNIYLCFHLFYVKSYSYNKLFGITHYRMKMENDLNSDNSQSPEESPYLKSARDVEDMFNATPTRPHPDLVISQSLEVRD